MNGVEEQYSFARTINSMSQGLFATIISCGIICDLGDYYGAEGNAQVYLLLLKLFMK